MTVRELKDMLEKYDDSFPVVAYTPDRNYVVDIFIEEVNVRYIGNYDSNRTQMYYDVEILNRGDEAVLISVESPKRRY